LDIARQRLRNQHLTRPQFDRPGEVVAWLGAVQAQDYLGALWAVGLRTRAAGEHDIERAIADRVIVRTWPLRGTLHFVAPADVRWMLKYLAPRMMARGALHRRRLELDAAVFARSTKVLVAALEGGRKLTRAAMYAKLEAARISTAGGRGLHILWTIAHDAVICFGSREGRQHTFALLDEWVPPARMPERDEALAELARRYVTSHGPATWQDFAWWSGLSAADARSALEMAKPHLLRETIDGQACWLPASTTATGRASRMSFLLPAYDEYTVAYRDRSAVLATKAAAKAGASVLSPTIVIGGQVVGTWTRTHRRDAVVIATRPFAKLGHDDARAVATATERYRAFLSSR
jgi:DNA glycosylase AlkZ-like